MILKLEVASHYLVSWRCLCLCISLEQCLISVWLRRHWKFRLRLLVPVGYTGSMQSIAIFGRQPELSAAELESLYGSSVITPISETVAALDLPASAIAFAQLGGVTKLATVLGTIPSTDWRAISSYLVAEVPQHTNALAEGKIHIGLSAIGLSVRVNDINATGLSIKKAVRANGRSVRMVPSKTLELNSAQVIHNHLTGERGWELLLIAYGHQTILAQTVAVQDIEAYAARDQARPMRDARVGMLPPKLAQIIINLARGKEDLQESRVKSQELRVKTVLDPFCGTGVILQEALLSGLQAYGSDLEPRMIEYSTRNLDWLINTHGLTVSLPPLEVADATKHRWQHFDMVACETYLGQPLSGLPAPAKLQQIIGNADHIHVQFLRNLANQLQRGARICIAVPAWEVNGTFKHLPVLDQLPQLGYTHISFVHVRDRDLIYHRPGQIVGRELVVLEKN